MDKLTTRQINTSIDSIGEEIILNVDFDGFRLLTSQEINQVIWAARRCQGEIIKLIFKTIGKYIRNLFNAFDNGISAAKTYDQLSRLSDKDLADIGMQRGDIAQRAYDGLANHVLTPDLKIYNDSIKEAYLTNHVGVKKAA